MLHVFFLMNMLTVTDEIAIYNYAFSWPCIIFLVYLKYVLDRFQLFLDHKQVFF
ncbi:uncharacterized protein DS421_20g685210 [Arachis hypogaea]|nr:uncharacterized protein DS421_20g685210 [Arachis hypogaea]